MADYAKVERLVDRYDRAIDGLEADVIQRLNDSLDASYRNLERELRRLYPTWQSQGSLYAVQRRLLLLEELKGVLEVVRPELRAEYEQLFQEAIALSHQTGGTLADELINTINPSYPLREFSDIPIEAVALQARDGVERLYRYNDDFRRAVSGVVEQGLTQGWGAAKVARVLRGSDEMQGQFGVAQLKSKAETIARTEIMSAYNDAAKQRYEQAGIDYVQIQVTPSEALCRLCLARNMRVYRRDEVRLPFHPRCLPGDVVVTSPTVKAGTTRQYVGKVVCLETASGKKLTATPNHPILTDKGWVAIDLINEGDHVFSCVDSERIAREVTPDNHQSPALISEVVSAFRESSGVSSVSMEVAPEDFHGDGSGSNVCVVSANSLLWDGRNAKVSQPPNHRLFVGRLVGAAQLLSQRLGAFFFPRQGTTPHCVMCGFNLPASLIRRHVLPLHRLGFGSTSNSNPGLCQNRPHKTSAQLTWKRFSDRVFGFTRQITGRNLALVLLSLRGKSSLDVLIGNSPRLGGTASQSAFLEDSPQPTGIESESLSGILNRFAGQIYRDRVIKSSVSHFNGPVYNLETSTGWYLANDILTHNCRCIVLPWLPDWQAKGLTDDAFAAEYRDRIMREAEQRGVKPDYGPTYWEKRNQGLTEAPKPVWSP